MAELADARDLKSRGGEPPWGFESPLGYLLSKDLRQRAGLFSLTVFWNVQQVCNDMVLIRPSHRWSLKNIDAYDSQAAISVGESSICRVSEKTLNRNLYRIQFRFSGRQFQRSLKTKVLRNSLGRISRFIGKMICHELERCFHRLGSECLARIIHVLLLMCRIGWCQVRGVAAPFPGGAGS